MSRRDRDPNRGRRKVPLSWFSAADEMGLNDEPVGDVIVDEAWDFARVDLGYVQFAEGGHVGPDVCKMCRKPIRMMVFRGTGYCSQSCEEAPF